MPIDFSNISSLNYKKFIIKNETSGFFIIGDLGMKLPPNSSVDLLNPPVGRIQKKKWTTQDVENSRDLRIALNNGIISIYTEFGKIQNLDGAVQAMNVATDYQVEKDVGDINIPEISVKKTTFTIDPNKDIGNKSATALDLINSSIPDWLELVDDTKVTLKEAGSYDINYSVPFTPYSNGARMAWIAKNGDFPAVIEGGINKGVLNRLGSLKNMDTYIRMNDIADRGDDILTGSYTVEFWYKPLAFGNTSTFNGLLSDTQTRDKHWIFSTYGPHSNYDYTLNEGIIQVSDGRLGVYYKRYGSKFSAMNPLTIGTWHHIAIVIDKTGGSTTAARFHVYVNGVFGGTANPWGATAVWNNSNDFLPGINLCCDEAGSFVIDDIRVSNIIRYSENFTPPTSLVVDASTVGAYPCQPDLGVGNYSIPTTSDYRGVLFEDISGNDYHMYLGSNGSDNYPGTFGIAASFSTISENPRYCETSSSSSGTSQPTTISASDSIDLEIDDYIEVYAYQDSGITLQSTSSDPGRLTIKKVSQ